jgi:pimeloyl-ACP methyl ester carboxylesterase
MSSITRLAIIGTLLFIGCNASVDLDRSEKQYALPDNSKNYTDLVERDPDELSQEELYNRALSLWNTPYRELRIPTSVGESHVIVAGPEDGEVVVLMHGLNASATMWYPNAAPLARHYRIYAVDDIIGGGKSQPSRDLESLDEVLDWYSELFDRLELEQVHLVGASRGGWVAIQMALNQPERIRSVALLSPAQTFSWIKPSFGLLENLRFSLDPERKKLRGALETMTANVDDISQLYIDQYYGKVREGTPSQFLLDMRPFDKKKLRSLQVPVLVLVGDQDIINDHKSLAKANRRLPDVETHVIEGAGHFVSFDGAEEVNAKLISFIAAHGGAAKK